MSESVVARRPWYPFVILLLALPFDLRTSLSSIWVKSSSTCPRAWRSNAEVAAPRGAELYILAIPGLSGVAPHWPAVDFGIRNRLHAAVGSGVSATTRADRSARLSFCGWRAPARGNNQGEGRFLGRWIDHQECLERCALHLLQERADALPLCARVDLAVNSSGKARQRVQARQFKTMAHQGIHGGIDEIRRIRAPLEQCPPWSGGRARERPRPRP